MTHIGICEPFSNPCIGGEQYFITFINDFSRYGCVYLLKDKTKALKYFKILKVEVENLLDSKIKVVILDYLLDSYNNMELLHSIY